MQGQRHTAVAYTPIALLVFAQLLLPGLGVVHAHENDFGLDAGAAGRPTVHGHGPGLPHGHLPGPLDKSPAGEGFHKIGSPVATRRASAAAWASAWTEDTTTPGTSTGASSSGPAIDAATLLHRGPWDPPPSGATTVEPAAANNPLVSARSTHPLRGPPSA